MSEGGGERVRLFVALDLPKAARDSLLRWRSGQRPLEGLRLTGADALHATLCFLGWRSAEEADPIAAACEATLHGLARPGLSLGESLWLPPRRPRVLAVRLEDSTGALALLQASVSDTLSRNGWYVPEKRPYLAHVTVARVPGRARVQAVELPPPTRLEFFAPTVTLYRSRLERGGAQYELLARVELA